MEAVIAVETKSAATVASDFFDALRTFPERAGGGGRPTDLRLVYGGATAQKRGDVQVIPWHEVQERGWV